MSPYPNSSEAWLERLVAFATVSRESNLDLISYVADYLSTMGIKSSLTHNDEHTKANLHAVIGSDKVPGVMLSGHTDVVPVDGQNWSTDPFKMVKNDTAYFGRGTAGMKGFIASMLAMVPAAAQANLKNPIHLALSYDEEIGCIGVQRMIDALELTPVKPAFCIVGEPTEMQPAIAHKGKTGIICRCTGHEAHSALAPKGLNAIYLANDMITAIRKLQDEVIADGSHDEDYEVPYTTFHVGTISGGTALNIVPNRCEFEFEIRNIAADNPEIFMDKFRQAAAEIISRNSPQFPTSNIEVEVFNAYPALNTDAEDEVVAFVKSLSGANGYTKVAFGTEGGLFQQRLGIATVVCGPGSMDQGHKRDEFLKISELEKCDLFLANLVDRLSSQQLN